MLHMNKNTLNILGFTLCLMTSTAYAQQVDYSGLESVFGEPVTTSATGKPQRVSEAPVSMEIITADEIARSGAIDIPQILQRLAGVEVIRDFRGSANVNIRGFNQTLSNRLLVLIDGRQVYMDNFGMVMWQTLPIQLSEIKQIEVVRGPNTSLFGFNASSGVVNIITFNPLFDKVNQLEAKAGTQEHREGSAVATKKVGEDAAFRLSGGLTRYDDFSRKHMSSYVSDEDTMDRKNLNLRGAFNLSAKSSLNVDAGTNNTESDNILLFHTDALTDTIFKHFDMNYSYDAGSAGIWQTHLYRNEIKFGMDASNFLSPLQHRAVENNLNVLKITDTLTPFTNHTFQAEVEARNNEFAGIKVGTGDAKFTMNIYSGRGMWEWKATDQLSFTNALRFDYWETDREGGLAATDTILNVTRGQSDRNELEYSFNSAAIYAPDDISYYRAGIARGLRVPTLLELAHSDTGFFELYGNPNLDTETNLTYELGYGRKFPSLDMKVDANIFYEQINHLISQTIYLPSPPGNGGTLGDLTFENVGSADAYGLELMSKGRFTSSLGWHANYTYTHLDDEVDGKPNHYLDFSATQPKHKINLGLDYNYEKWDFSVDAHYVSAIGYTASIIDFSQIRKYEPIDDFVTLNTHLGYRLTENTHVALDGFNLLDEHFERPSYQNGGGSVTGGNQIGRAVLFTVKHTF